MFIYLLDNRMIKYGCLSMGEEIGMIEVVKNAKTVNDVRKNLKATALNEWLHNENRERYIAYLKTCHTLSQVYAKYYGGSKCYRVCMF